MEDKNIFINQKQLFLNPQLKKGATNFYLKAGFSSPIVFVSVAIKKVDEFYRENLGKPWIIEKENPALEFVEKSWKMKIWQKVMKKSWNFAFL